MLKKTTIFSIIISIFFIYNGNTENKVFIKFKVDNEIITNIDLENEKNYLIALNNNLANVSNKELNELSKNSLIKEKIKNKELVKFFDLEKVETFGEKITKNYYENAGIKSKEDFKKAEIATDDVLVLPIHNNLGTKEVDSICLKINNYFKN